LSNFRLPADYYSSPASEVVPVFPRWVPAGCGGVSAFLLVVFFAGGAFVQSGRAEGLFDLMMAQMQSELAGLYTNDVTPAQKSALDQQYSALRQNLKAKKVKSDQLMPLLQTMRTVSEDQKVTPPEVDKLTAQLRDINAQRPARIDR
jgi:hypothetical protein